MALMKGILIKMEKHRTIIIISIVIISTIITSALLINVWLDPYYRPDKDKMEKYFKRDKDDIVLIAEYFADSNSESFHLTDLNFHSTNYNKTINDEKVVKAFTQLFEKRGYSVISKNGNTIYFQKWTRGADLGIGIAYSINGEDKPILDFLTKLEPLSEKNWYFYEADYNEWRIK